LDGEDLELTESVRVAANTCRARQAGSPWRQV